MKRIQLGILTLFIATGACVGAAFAQAGASTGAAVTAPAPAKPAKQLSASEQAAAADAVVVQGQKLAQQVGTMLDEARGEADIIRITCLNDKLMEINAVLRSAQARVGTLGRAADTDARNHEFTVLMVLGQKFQVLDQEANQCVGQDMYETGTTKVVTEIDTNLLPFEKTPGSPPVMLPPGVPTIPPPASGKD